MGISDWENVCQVISTVTLDYRKLPLHSSCNRRLGEELLRNVLFRYIHYGWLVLRSKREHGFTLCESWRIKSIWCRLYHWDIPKLVVKHECVILTVSFKPHQDHQEYRCPHCHRASTGFHDSVLWSEGTGFLSSYPSILQQPAISESRHCIWNWSLAGVQHYFPVSQLTSWNCLHRTSSDWRPLSSVPLCFLPSPWIRCHSCLEGGSYELLYSLK